MDHSLFDYPICIRKQRLQYRKATDRDLVGAEMDLRAASEARADEFAPMDLQSAREKLEGSKKAMAAKRYEDARRLAESAQVEAELAEVKAETEIMRRAAEELQKGIDALATDAERGSRKSLSKGPDKE